MPPDASPSELERITHELYSVPPEEFTAARTGAEKAARASGDRALAAAVKALRRPAVAAWAVNQLVRERGELARQVVELGASLRQAQAGLQGDALRELTRQRRQLVAAVTTEARQLAAAHGQRLSDAAARQVEETLQAAMADPAAGRAVLSGVLAQPLSSTGVESLGVDALGSDAVGSDAVGAERDDVAASEPGPRRALTVVRDDGRARREAEARVEEAERSVRAATKALAAARKKQQKARARVLQVEAELDELRRRVADLEAVSEETAERLERQESSVATAEGALEEARQAAATATAALDAL